MEQVEHTHKITWCLY